MSLGLSVSLIFLLILGISGLLLYCYRKKTLKWMIPLIITMRAALVLVVIYAVLTFVLTDAAGNPATTNPVTATTETSEKIQRETSTDRPVTNVTPSRSTFSVTRPSQTTGPTAENGTLVPPAEQVLAQHPDILGLRELEYQVKPTFTNQNDISKFILHNFLNNCFDFEFYLTESFYYDELTDPDILFSACDAALSYYFFSAFEIYDMYVEDDGTDNKVLATIKIEYLEPEYDQIAHAAARKFVAVHPVPKNGFADYESEKAYAKKIHDYIAKRITYAPVGNDPEGLSALEHYEAYQEAYNALAAPDYTAVCAGYARGFALIAQYAGINAVYVYGNEEDISSHAWNMIYPCDGSEAVLIDLTWNDTYSNDVPDQDFVSDYYFYLDLAADYEHTMAGNYADFLQYINE